MILKNKVLFLLGYSKSGRIFNYEVPAHHAYQNRGHKEIRKKKLILEIK